MSIKNIFLQFLLDWYLLTAWYLEQNLLTQAIVWWLIVSFLWRFIWKIAGWVFVKSSPLRSLKWIGWWLVIGIYNFAKHVLAFWVQFDKYEHDYVIYIFEKWNALEYRYGRWIAPLWHDIENNWFWTDSKEYFTYALAYASVVKSLGWRKNFKIESYSKRWAFRTIYITHIKVKFKLQIEWIPIAE